MVKTEPAAGTVVAEGESVTIYISQGVDVVKTMIPNFVGLSEAQTLIRLMEYDLTVGDVTYVKSDMTAGSVVEQSVTAWLEVPQYSSVDFKVSGGASYSGNGKTLPSVSDMNSAPETTPAETKPTHDETDNSSGDDNYYEETETAPSDNEDDWFQNDNSGLVSSGGGNLFKGSE